MNSTKTRTSKHKHTISHSLRGKKNKEGERDRNRKMVQYIIQMVCVCIPWLFLFRKIHVNSYFPLNAIFGMWRVFVLLLLFTTDTTTTILYYTSIQVLISLEIINGQTFTRSTKICSLFIFYIPHTHTDIQIIYIHLDECVWVCVFPYQLKFTIYYICNIDLNANERYAFVV